MNERVLILVSMSAGTTLLAAVGFGFARAVDAFEPCRGASGQHDAIRDSLACQTHSAVLLFSSAMVLATLVLAAAAVVVGGLGALRRARRAVRGTERDRGP